MAGERIGARSSSPSRAAGSEPPGFDRVAGAFARAGRVYIVLGVVTLVAGLGLLAGSLSGGPLTQAFLSAGVFVAGLSAYPFVQGWRRLQRVAFLDQLRGRWVMLARAGDPDDQVTTLRRAYDGLIAGDVRARMSTAR